MFGRQTENKGSRVYRQAVRPRPIRYRPKVELLESRQLLSVNIRAVAGESYDGGSVSVRGSGFLATGPVVSIFDDFEDGVEDGQIKTGPGSATVGQWDYLGDNDQVTYSSLNKVSGNFAARGNLEKNHLNYVGSLLAEGTKDVFVSYWTLIPAGTLWPGEGHPDGVNWKRVWMMGEHTEDDDRTLPSDGSRRFPEPTYHNLHCNDCPQVPYFVSSIQKGSWLRTWGLVKGRADRTGELLLWEMTASGVEQKINLRRIQTLYEGGVFERIHMNGYGRKTDGSFPTFDDFYVATGLGALARVEIGNGPTYKGSTKMTITTPTQWSDKSIVTTVRKGQFTPGETGYLYVTNANGEVNETGYPIVFTGGPAPLDNYPNKTLATAVTSSISVSGATTGSPVTSSVHQLQVPSQGELEVKTPEEAFLSRSSRSQIVARKTVSSSSEWVASKLPVEDGYMSDELRK